MLLPTTDYKHAGQIHFFIYWWMDRMFYGFSCSKLPVTAVAFMKINIVSKRKKS